MRFSNETEFENFLRNLIKENIVEIDDQFIVFENKNLADIVIFRNGENPAIFFVEVKHNKETMNRLGVGGRNGSGYQPEILKKRPDYLESHLTWVLYSEEHDNEGIVMVNSKTLTENYISGGIVGDKYNGINKQIFQNETGLDEVQFIEKLTDWLNTT